MNSLLGRFGKSRIVEWTIAYLAFVWLVIQIIDVIADVWLLSDAFQRKTHVALAFGLPATAIIAWFHGKKGPQRFARAEVLILAVLSGVAALAIPSAGGTESVAVLGIPPTVVLPCALITLLAIPAALIVVSINASESKPSEETASDGIPEFDEAESELWQQLLKAKYRSEVRDIQQQIDRWLDRNPKSVGLKRLKALAKTIAAKTPEPFLGADRGILDVFDDPSMPATQQQQLGPTPDHASALDQNFIPPTPQPAPQSDTNVIPDDWDSTVSSELNGSEESASDETAENDEAESELWQRLGNAKYRSDVRNIQRQIGHLLDQNQESVSLKRLKALAKTIAAKTPEQFIGADRVPPTPPGSTTANDIPDDWGIGDSFGATGASIADIRQKDSIASRIWAELKQRNVTRAARIYAIIVVSVSAIAFLIFVFSPSYLQDVPPPTRAVAVLPFVNMNADEDSAYISDGLADAVRHILAQEPGLMVATRASSFRSSFDGLDVRAVGILLNVRTVLEGSVQRDDDKVHVAVQLTDISSGHQLWSHNFDGDFDDIIGIQDEIATEIRSELIPALNDHESKTSTHKVHFNLMSAASMPYRFDVIRNLLLALIVLGFSMVVVVFWYHGRRTVKTSV